MALGALKGVYTGVIEAHRKTTDVAGELHQVTHDVRIVVSGQLEQFHWFGRAHLEQADGPLARGNARTERSAPDLQVDAEIGQDRISRFAVELA